MKIKFYNQWQLWWLIILAILMQGCAKCIRGHHEKVHHESWVQWILIGKVVYPIYHSAYDANEFVCDEYQKEPRNDD